MSIDLSLCRIEKLLSRFERYTRQTIHIAGTNGKGSVSALLTRIFLAADLTVGRFNSPHLVSVHDSITINGSSISEELFDSVINEVRALNEDGGIRASSFEALTVAALLVFERAGLDVVICEVGMGGRLDATNIIPDAAILMSVITSIDLDHQAFLGTTTAAIAAEKAGIIREKTPVVLGAQQHRDVVEVIKIVSSRRGAGLIYAPLASDRDWDEMIDGPGHQAFSLVPFRVPSARPVDVVFSDGSYKVLLPLHGDHQLANLGTALSVFHTLRGDIRSPSLLQKRISSLSAECLHKAIQETIWPGRLSFHTYSIPGSVPPRIVPILADGAHNGAASKMLASYVSDLIASLPLSPQGNRRPISLTYILALSHSPPKTPASVLLPLLSTFSSSKLLTSKLTTSAAFLRFSPPEGMPWVKSVAPSAMADIFHSAGARASGLGEGEEMARNPNVWIASDDEVTDARSDLERALHWAAEQSMGSDGSPVDALIVVAGSLYLIADFYRLLKDREGHNT